MSKNESETDKNKPIELKIGLERFLQVKPQKRGIMAILRSKYAAEVHVQAEWETIVMNVLNRKVK